MRLLAPRSLTPRMCPCAAPSLRDSADTRPRAQWDDCKCGDCELCGGEAPVAYTGEELAARQAREDAAAAAAAAQEIARQQALVRKRQEEELARVQAQRAELDANIAKEVARLKELQAQVRPVLAMCTCEPSASESHCKVLTMRTARAHPCFAQQRERAVKEANATSERLRAAIASAEAARDALGAQVVALEARVSALRDTVSLVRWSPTPPAPVACIASEAAARSRTL